MDKYIILAVVLTTAHAGFLSAPATVSYYSSGLTSNAAVSYSTPAAVASPAAITSSHSNILRTPGNLGQVSTYSKTIDTPYSSVSKSDVRISNPGIGYTSAAAPVYSSSYYGSTAYGRGYGSAALVTPASVSYSSSLAAPASVSYSSLAAPAAITSSHSNILRTPGNLGQVSTYSKTIDTPYSSVSKSDVRVSNPGIAYSAAAPAVAAYAAPAYSSTYYGSSASSRGYGAASLVAPAAVSYSSSLAAPASVSYSSLAAPAAITSSHSNILRTPGNLGQVSTYSKTIDTPYSSVSKSDVRVSNPGIAYSAAAPAVAAYAAPAYSSTYYGSSASSRGYGAASLVAPAAVSYSSSLAAPASVSYSSLAAPAAITSSHSNILRTPGNLGQVSTYSKTIDTPYSSVSKSDVRVSNPGIAYSAAAPAVAAYAAPAYSSTYYGSSASSRGYGAASLVAPASVSYSSLAAPASVSYSSLAAPAAITSSHSNILRTPGNLGQVSTYSKTIDTPYSSVSKSDVRVSNPGISYTSAAPAVTAYAAPAYSSSYYGSVAYSRGYGAAALLTPSTVSYSSSLAAPASVSFSSLAAPAAVAYATRAAVASPAAITSSHSNILRTPGNLGQLSTYSKTIDTPYSSVSKSDVRASNSALSYGLYGAVASPGYTVSSYGFPSYARSYATPASYASYLPASGASHVSFSGLGAVYNW